MLGAHVMQQARRRFSTSMQQFTHDPRTDDCPQRLHCTYAQWMVPPGDALLTPAYISCLGAHARKKQAAAQLHICSAYPLPPYAPTLIVDA